MLADFIAKLEETESVLSNPSNLGEQVLKLLATSVGRLKQAISQYQTAVTALAFHVSDLKQDRIKLEKRIGQEDDHEEEVSDMKEQIQELKGKMADLEHDLKQEKVAL
jgi:seryl-tRNA synthetase